MELRETGGDNLGDVALLVAFGDGDGFVELPVFERASNLLDEDARLLARRAVHQGAVDHDAEGVDGKNEKDDDNNKRGLAHSFEHVE